MNPINLYSDNPAETRTEKEFLPKDTAGTGFRMKMFSIKDRDNCWQCTFETGNGFLYSQKFWKSGAGATDEAALLEIKGQWITCDIEITDRGFQRIFNVDLEDEPPEHDATPETTAEYLSRTDDVPF